MESNNRDKRGIWATDGTPGGTTRIFDRTFEIRYTNIFSAFGRAFVRDHPEIPGLRWYETDGTAAGTRPVHYIGAGADLYIVADQPLYSGTFQQRLLIRAGGYLASQIWSIDPDVATGSISGHAFRDLNRNGRAEGFEQGLAATPTWT
jgi:hypothetical protein